MNKVGILTFTYGDNFGQRLQNLALQEVITRLGFDVYTIPQILPLNYKINNIERHSIFETFDKNYIKYYCEPIGDNYTPNGIDDFKFFVAGSDQIWSPISKDVNKTFFLRFAPRYKRIAYAPSISTSKIPLRKSIIYFKYINGFRKLSVREYKAKNILKKITNKSISVLIDPTLMFDASFWKKYEKKPNYNVPSNFILYYGLGDNDESQYIKDLAKDMECDYIILREGNKKFNIGPSEFLYLIDNASAIATDSYHGTVFSIIYNKKLYYIKRKNNNIDMSDRFETLFYKLGISLDQNSAVKFDYDKVKEKLNTEREESIKFLQKGLKCNI